MGAAVWARAGASLCPHVHKEILPKRNPKIQKEQRRTNTNKKAGTFWAVSSVDGTFSAVSSVGGTFWAVSIVGGTFRAVSSVCGTFWAVLIVGGTLLAVLRVGGTLWRYFLGGSGKTKIWRHFFGGNQYRGGVLTLAFCRFSSAKALRVGGDTKI